MHWGGVGRKVSPQTLVTWGGVMRNVCPQTKCCRGVHLSISRISISCFLHPFKHRQLSDTIFLPLPWQLGVSHFVLGQGALAIVKVINYPHINHRTSPVWILWNSIPSGAKIEKSIMKTSYCYNHQETLWNKPDWEKCAHLLQYKPWSPSHVKG